MTTDTAALIRQMREALAARRAFDTEPGCAINRKLYGEMDYAIAAADEWLAQQRGPLTDEEIDALDIGGYPKGTFNTRSEYDRAVRRMLARAIERAHGITGEQK